MIILDLYVRIIILCLVFWELVDSELSKKEI